MRVSGARRQGRLADLPRAFWVVWAGTLVNRLGGFVVPFLGLYLTSERGLSVAQVGTLLSLFGVGQIVSGMVGGLLADRWGRKATLLLSLFGGATCMVALGSVQSTLAFALLLPLSALLGEMYRPAVSALIADVVPIEHRLRAYGLQYWVTNLGFSAASMLAGWLASRAYFYLFLGDALTSALYGLIVLFSVSETRPENPSLDRGFGLGIRRVMQDRVYMGFVALAALNGMLFAQLQLALPVHLRGLGFSETQYGFVIAINGVLIVTLQPFVARVVERFAHSTTLACGSLLMGLGFFLHGLGRVLSVHAIAVGVWTLGEIIWMPVAATVIAALAPRALRGRYQGSYTTAVGVSGVLGTLLGSAALQRLGPAAVFWGCLGLGVMGAIGFLVSGSARQRRMDMMLQYSEE